MSEFLDEEKQSRIIKEQYKRLKVLRVRNGVTDVKSTYNMGEGI